MALGRTLVPFQLNDRAARGVHQLTQRSSATPGALNELLGDELAALMIAAMGELGANLFEHNVHVRLGAFVEFNHARLHQQDAAKYAGFFANAWPEPIIWFLNSVVCKREPSLRCNGGPSKTAAA